ncbi:MAG: hypothetical protein RLZZ28_1003 [Bacteroidota bacterium]|jgi:hypothetical protein
MGRSIATILMILAGFIPALSQQVLKGRVVSADNGLPIAAANVFLSNTSIGVQTDAGGEFLIRNFPSGRYDLVVSFIGYEPYQVSVASDKIPSVLNISLKPKVDELQEVIVEPYEKNGWDTWGTVFSENFMGSAAFAANCIIQNREVLKFRYSKHTNILRVSADDRLIIENKALGYLLKYDLTRFEYNLNTKVFFYQGYPFFADMIPTSKRMQKKWEENRKEAYYGSLMHFMRAVYDNKLTEQGFEVRKMILVTEEEIQRVKWMLKVPPPKWVPGRTPTTYPDGQSVNTNLTYLQHEDSVDYYRKIWYQFPGKPIVLLKLQTADSISTRLDSTTKGLIFDTDIQVVYKNKKNPFEYRKYLSPSMYYGYVSSELSRVSENIVKVFKNGSFFEGRFLMNSGYWAWWEKMCNKLPYEYDPNNTN